MGILGRFALAIAAVALVAGCGSQSPIGAPRAIGSWMSPESRKASLLYISDEGTSDVYIYSLSKGTLVGTLTGFSEPRGLCLDKAGNIWITEAGASKLLEYTPGGTEPINSLSDSDEYPIDCSVNMQTGSLGVSNIISGGNGKYGPGSLSLYSGTVGAPAIVPAFSHTYSDTYDTAGNLFVDGANDLGWFQLGELARDGKTVTNLTLKGATITEPSSMQYADGNLAIGDGRGHGTSVIDQITVKGATARVIGRTHFHDANVIAFFILGHQVFCLNSAYGGVRVAIYNYPAGGTATRVIKTAGLSIPVGLVVTAAK